MEDDDDLVCLPDPEAMDTDRQSPPSSPARTGKSDGKRAASSDLSTPPAKKRRAVPADGDQPEVIDL